MIVCFLLIFLLNNLLNGAFVLNNQIINQIISSIEEDLILVAQNHTTYITCSSEILNLFYKHFQQKFRSSDNNCRIIKDNLKSILNLSFHYQFDYQVVGIQCIISNVISDVQYSGFTIGRFASFYENTPNSIKITTFTKSSQCSSNYISMDCFKQSRQVISDNTTCKIRNNIIKGDIIKCQNNKNEIPKYITSAVQFGNQLGFHESLTLEEVIKFGVNEYIISTIVFIVLNIIIKNIYQRIRKTILFIYFLLILDQHFSLIYILLIGYTVLVEFESEKFYNRWLKGITLNMTILQQLALTVVSQMISLQIIPSYRLSELLGFCLVVSVVIQFLILVFSPNTSYTLFIQSILFLQYKTFTHSLEYLVQHSRNEFKVGLSFLLFIKINHESMTFIQMFDDRMLQFKQLYSMNQGFKSFYFIILSFIITILVAIMFSRGQAIRMSIGQLQNNDEYKQNKLFIQINTNNRIHSKINRDYFQNFIKQLTYLYVTPILLLPCTLFYSFVPPYVQCVYENLINIFTLVGFYFYFVNEFFFILVLSFGLFFLTTSKREFRDLYDITLEGIKKSSYMLNYNDFKLKH